MPRISYWDSVRLAITAKDGKLGSSEFKDISPNTVRIAPSGSVSCSNTSLLYANRNIKLIGDGGIYANTSTYSSTNGECSMSCWITASASNSASAVNTVISCGVVVGSSSAIIYTTANPQAVRASVYNSSGTGYLIGGVVIPTDIPTHVELCREIGGTWKFYVNGSLIGSNSSIANFYVPTDELYIGYSSNNINRVFIGYIEDVMTVNKCLHTANFTPPTKSLREYDNAISGSFTDNLTNDKYKISLIDTTTNKVVGSANIDATTGSSPYPYTINHDSPNPVLAIVSDDILGSWKKNTSYTVGQRIVPTDTITTPYIYQRTIAGDSSNSTEPTWSSTISSMTSDNGSSCWQCVARIMQPLINGPLQAI